MFCSMQSTGEWTRPEGRLAGNRGPQLGILSGQATRSVRAEDRDDSILDAESADRRLDFRRDVNELSTLPGLNLRYFHKDHSRLSMSKCSSACSIPTP